MHEFSSIEGVREDVTDIILNIKALAVRMHAEGPKKMRLSAEGPCEVTAAQIEAGADIEIMNPDLVICTLDKGAKLSMEMTVDTGKGYRPAAQNRPEEALLVLFLSILCSHQSAKCHTKWKTHVLVRSLTTTS